jgi:tRNA pseudouridine55 synthase
MMLCKKLRRLFSAAKGGHTGTLDPLATGLLPLCFGEATKFSADLLDADKTYEAEIKLGVTTDSGDAEGKVIATAAVNVSEGDISRVLPCFTGAIQQVPPMHSALKRNGRPLYELAEKVSRLSGNRVQSRFTPSIPSTFLAIA